MTRLEGPRAKLERSAHHITELNTAARAYLDSGPYRVTREEDANGDLVYRVRISLQVPLILSAMVGDAVHNMRSALDGLAWQLVVVNGGQPTRETRFPIGQDSLSAFESALRRALRGSSPAARRLIQRLRPYAGGNSILGQLHALDVADKHRDGLIVGAANKHVVLKMKLNVPWQSNPVESPPLALTHDDRQFPLRDGIEVFRVCAAARRSGYAHEHDLVFELAFGDVEEIRGLPLSETLTSMHGHVSKIVEITAKLFF